jgi:phosphonate transport system substrate-binding protein
MFHKYLSTVLCVVLLMVLVACGGDKGETPPTATPEIQPTPSETTIASIVLGDVGNSPTDTIKTYQPLADYLAEKLAAYGITMGAVKTAPDIETMAQMLTDDEIDVYFDSAYPAMIVTNTSDAKPILRRWKGGAGEYHTVFFVRADSGITSLDDLRGKIIVFENSFSTSGFMLPMAYLIESGYNPVEKSGPDQPVADNEIGYVFTRLENAAVEWVARGRAPAGAADNLTYDELVASAPAELRILAETESIPRHIVMVRGDLEPKVVEAIKQLLLDLDTTPEGQAILKTLKTSQFDEFPEGIDKALAHMQQLYNTVQQHPHD